MAVNAPISNAIDTGLSAVPEQVDDPKTFAELMLVYRSIKGIAAQVAADLATAAADLTALQAYNTTLVWTSGADLVLGIGQSAKITATAATSIPLHVACGDGQIYEIEMVGRFTPAAVGASTLLLINNATMSGNFGFFYHQVYGASTIAGANTTLAATGFVISSGCSPYYAKATVFTPTNLKSFFAESRGYETTTGNRQWRVMMDAPDTTTVWSSIGTITMPNAWTGTITVRRIA